MDTATTAPPSSKIDFRGVCKSFGHLRVLDSIDLDVALGEVVVICGPSGSGKSTLIRMVNRLEEISAGEIFIDGMPISKLTGRALRQLRLGIGFVFQQFNLYPHLTAEENVTLALRKLRHVSAAAARARAAALLARVGLTDKQHAYPAALSGGQQQRVAIARALAMEPDILLFDEPTSALDPEMVGEVLAVIRELAHTGITMLVVTHEMGFARELADRVVFIDGGRIGANTSAAEFFNHPSDPRLRRFLSQVRAEAEGMAPID